MNTARIDPEYLCVVGSRMRVVGKRDTKPSMAFGVMTGTVTESFLFVPAESGTSHATYTNHKLTIAPFEQDFRRDTAVWGQLFGFHVISGSISPAGFSFTTRAEGRGDSWRPRECSSFVSCLVL